MAHHKFGLTQHDTNRIFIKIIVFSENTEGIAVRKKNIIF